MEPSPSDRIHQMLTDIGQGTIKLIIPLHLYHTSLQTIILLQNMLLYEFQSLNFETEGNLQRSEIIKTKEAALAVSLSVYITDHLHEKLPSTRELAIMLGTNELKLKESFRKTYAQSIHRYFNEKRLEKARLEIIRSDKTLNQIADDFGFAVYH